MEWHFHVKWRSCTFFLKILLTNFRCTFLVASLTVLQSVNPNIDIVFLLFVLHFTLIIQATSRGTISVATHNIRRKGFKLNIIITNIWIKLSSTLLDSIIISDTMSSIYSDVLSVPSEISDHDAASSIYVVAKPHLWRWSYRKWSRAHAQPKVTSPEAVRTVTRSHGRMLCACPTGLNWFTMSYV
jgi:hypothetical protein